MPQEISVWPQKSDLEDFGGKKDEFANILILH